MRADDECLLCGIALETVNHALFQCCFSRQVWALANIPSPKEGFQKGSIYSNMAFLFGLINNQECDSEVKKIIPWVLWWIWKDRNTQLFEGTPVSAEETVRKLKLDALAWIDAQEEEDAEEERMNSVQGCRKVWVSPVEGFLKCNVGFHWSKNSEIGGASWVLRDSNGSVLYHGRNRFTNMVNVEEAKMKSLLWAVESMRSMRKTNVLFAFQDAQLVKAIQRPKAWPSFRNQVMDFYKELGRMQGWSVVCEFPSANRGAKLIAISATKPQFWESYISSSSPRWLKDLFDAEKSSLMER